ncbi:TVP38/TMEM64 family protein [Companilactobacillus zhongbaensis]|uniref:TVP38/TMEM64 family protein n=1 Tax=Companilactobacillus zhongbaensis TaxID=2486009 RepID=UPI001CDD3B77|nr:TVP38/TMEM64 family protein [Companilactobacillus zhongbaensis]
MYLYYGKHLRQNWAIFRLGQTFWITIIILMTLLAVYHLVPLIVVLGTIFNQMFHTNVSGNIIAILLLMIIVITLVILIIDNYYHPVEKIKTNHKFKKMTIQSKIGMVLTVVVLIMLVGLYYVIPAYRDFINNISAMLVKMDIKALRDYINGFGAYGPLISALLMIFQSILAPLPAFVLTFANAYLYGWYWGATLSWTSSMIGALLCFYIARGLGRPFAEKLITENALSKMDRFFDEYGDFTIIILRLLPFVSFDEVSYGAGFTDMKTGKFLIATGIGQLPATIVYSIVGGSLDGNKNLLFIGIIAFVLLIVLSLLAKRIVKNRQVKR